MAEQWEMCDVANMTFLYFFTPKGAQTVKYKDYIKSSHNQVTGDNDRAKAICLLLSEGWEPFGSAEYYCSFRRKIQS